MKIILCIVVAIMVVAQFIVLDKERLRREAVLTEQILSEKASKDFIQRTYEKAEGPEAKAYASAFLTRNPDPTVRDMDSVSHYVDSLNRVEAIREIAQKGGECKTNDF